LFVIYYFCQKLRILRIAHFLAIAASVALIVLLYLGGNTIPPKNSFATKNGHNPNTSNRPSQPPPVNVDSIIAEAKNNLQQSESEEITALEAQLSKLKDSSVMLPVFKNISSFWNAKNNIKIGAYYNGIVAKLENSEKSLNFAARLFLDLLEDEDNPSFRSWEAGEAALLSERSYKLDSTIEETKLSLATAYIEGAGEPMKGVQILLAIVNQKPKDIPANLLLGKMSIQSGQWEKSITRLQTVLMQDSGNKEALYFLAEAYKGTGNKEKAIETLQKCKKLVNNPEFDRKANEEINSLK